MLMKVETQVTKETHELGLAVKAVLLSVKKAKADGWDAGTDLPAIILESVQALMPAIEGVEKVGEEFKDEPLKATLGALLPVAEGIEAFLVKEESAE